MQNPSKLRPFFENIEYEREGANMILNFGPQHPSAHGQLKLVLELDGERIVRARPGVGYMHRGIEKMAENMIDAEFVEQLRLLCRGREALRHRSAAPRADHPHDLAGA